MEAAPGAMLPGPCWTLGTYHPRTLFSSLNPEREIVSISISYPGKQKLRGLAQGQSLGRAVPRTQRGVRSQGNYKTYVSPFHTAWQKQDPTPRAPDFEPNVTSSRGSETPRPGQGKKSPDTAAPGGRGAWGTVHSPAPSPSELPLDCVVELGVPRAQPTFPVSQEGAGGAVPLS